RCWRRRRPSRGRRPRRRSPGAGPAWSRACWPRCRRPRAPRSVGSPTGSWRCRWPPDQRQGRSLRARVPSPSLELGRSVATADACPRGLRSRGIIPRMTDLHLVDLARLSADVEVAAKEYAAADPFPHIVVDDVLRPDAFAAAVADFPAVDDEFWKGYLHV